MTQTIFDRRESQVKSYCRRFSAVFEHADNASLLDDQGNRYIDLLAGAGTLNYGHNNPAIISPVVEYIKAGGIVHSLDLHTKAKAAFLDAFERIILWPRDMDYRVQFPGPTGTNAVEAALKLARKVTGRTNVVAFTNGYHGMTLGALAATSSSRKRAGAGTSLGQVTFLPYDGFLGENIDAAEVARLMLEKRGSGIDRPAAFLIETVQGEGGLQSCRPEWFRAIASLARRLGALLIVDDIQAGCGRTGTFFSFEPFGEIPDIVVLSKALSGFGTPLAIVLIKPEHDKWLPGEHNGTFRGNNLGFVGATSALQTYWTNSEFADAIATKASLVHARLQAIVDRLPRGYASVRGRGLMTGIAFTDPTLATLASERLYALRILLEDCGPDDEVLKLLPPLTIPLEELTVALDAIEHVVLGLAPAAEWVA